ncbi:MAG: metallophosphoesterase [Thermoleophilia bacterium]|nr:metallophosphoesterase [Thermoleophilia bacterium]
MNPESALSAADKAEEEKKPKPFIIAHISDIHAGSQYFVPNLMDRAVIELNELKPNVVIVTGDLTDQGFKQEYLLAKSYLDKIDCENLLVVPGNHDARNVGYVHFEEMFGSRQSILHRNGLSIVGVDSSEPDLDYGTVGRHRYKWVKEQFTQKADFRVFILHHHLLPVPGTGRERNMVYDAGDILEVLQQCQVNMILSGHKHVPYAWRLENIFAVNAGTVCTLRLRGKVRPCYNVIEIGEDECTIWRKYPFHDADLIIKFCPSTVAFEKSPATESPTQG